MRRLHALVLVPLTCLAACSAPAAAPATTAAPASSAASASAATSSAAATTSTPAEGGGVLAGSGYRLTLPEGFVDATAEFKKMQSQVDTGAKLESDNDAFTDNINVITQTSAEVPLDQFKPVLQQQLETAGSTGILFKNNVQLDGKDALQVWSITKDAGDARTIQFMTFNAGKVFVLTLSTNLSEAKAEALAQQVVAGWKWA